MAARTKRKTPSHLRRTLQEKGYVVVKGLVSEVQCEAVLENTVALLKRLTPLPSKLRAPRAWKQASFQTHLRKLRQEDPERFGALYDAAQSSAVLSQLLTSPSVTEMVANLLNCTPAELSSSGHIQRIDPPEDSRNLYDWHQELSYYPQNREGTHGLAVWIPLLDVPIENGALITAEGSHKEGYVKTPPQKEGLLHSTQHHIPSKVVEKYKPVTLPLKAGDALIMYMTTMHKSGANLSDRFRFVAIGRYHHATSKDFIPYRYVYKFNGWKKQQLKREGWDVSDLV